MLIITIALCVVPAWAENVSGANFSGMDGEGMDAMFSPSNATAPGEDNSTAIPVQQTVAWVNVTPASAEMTVNDVLSFSAAAYDSSGTVVPDVVFAWNSSDPSVGTVNQTGLFTALAPGSAVITASVANSTVNGAANVTVSAPLIQTSPTPENETIPKSVQFSSVGASPGGVIPDTNNVFLRVSNDDGARFDDFGNNTYNIRWTGDASEIPANDGGQNALHITDDLSTTQKVTFTNNLAGTFWVTDTGGRYYKDEILLLIAVNGTIPDNFRLHLKADGYQWVPNPTPHAPPALEDITYEAVTLDEWFTKDDLIYGPQTWRPAAHTTYPLYPGQDVTNTSNTFRMMLVDLNAGDRYGVQPVRVQYEVENLNSFMAVNAYAYSKNADVGVYNITCWTNRLLGNPGEFSGYYVSGAPLPPAARVTISPESASVPVNGKQTFSARAYDENGDEIVGAPFTWSSSVPGVGTIGTDGVFSPASEGSTIITASTNGASGEAQVTVTGPVEKVLTSITMDPASVVMYTDNIGNQTFVAKGYDQFGDEITPLAFRWSSTNESVGTVDSSGRFSGISAGITDVQAQNGTVTGTAQVLIKPNPDWNVTLIGAVNGTLNRSTIIDLSHGGLLSYTDPSGKLWEGVNLSAIIGLVDDSDPATFNASLASRDYNITVVGKAAGNDKTVLITGRELLDGDTTFIAAYKVNGFEIPEGPIDGRTYWPLKLTGSGIAHVGKNLEEITEISLEFPPDIRKINITPDIVRTWESGEPLQFDARGYDASGTEVPFVSYTWTSSNTSVGTVDQTGYFTPTGSGTTTVWADFHGVNGSATVYVYPDNLPPHAWIVDQMGNGDFRTITEAIACARDGDTVLVRDGVYNELFKLEKGITLRSENGPSNTTITNANRAFMIEVLADNVSISGFTLKQTGFATIASKNAIRITKGDNCTISGNIFSDTQYCIYVYTGHVSYMTIAGNKFNSPTTSIYLTTCDHAVVRNNIIEGGKDNTILVYGNGDSLGNIVENNTISSDSIGGGGIGYANSFGGRISNNTIYNAGRGLYIRDAPNTVVRDNIIGECTESNVYLRDSIKNITFTGNELKGGKTGTFYLNSIKDGDSASIYMNDISTHPAKPGNFFYCKKSSPLALNSTEPISYVYNGTTYTNFVGNYFASYAGNDTDGDGLGDTPFVASGVNHYHPLVSPIDNYLVLTPTTITVTPAAATLEAGESVNFTAEVFDQRGETMPGAVPVWSSGNTTLGVVNATTGLFDALSSGNVTVSAVCDGCTGSAVVTVVPATKKTETLSFDVPNCTFSENSSGHSISVNASAASINGSRLTVRGNGFNLTLRTTSDPVTAGGQVNATYDGMVLETDPLVADLPLPGTVSGSIRANLTGLPAGAGITTTLSQNITDEVMSAFQLAASEDGLNVDGVAFTMNIQKTNLTNGQDVSDATIRMTASPAWVNAHGGVGAVRIIRWAEDGTKEVLTTTYLGTDTGGNLVFEAYSPNGLSLFGLAATSTPPSGSTVSSHSSSGGGSSDVAAISGSIPAGETKSFAVTETAVTRITVDAYDAIDDMLVTVQKASLPKDIAAPTQTTFQVIETTLYRADPSAIDRVTLEFAVPTSWIEDHDLSTGNIVLLGYENNGWKALTTTFLKEENGQALYSARASGFSYFAIVAGTTASAASPVQAEETTMPAGEAVQTASPSQSATTLPQKSPLPWGLAILAFGAVFMMRRR
ncbi:Ig-like domain-containing protein [Methanofollis ethanolicus]|uniref:Ig-like domain-containing protein n=1 Tax=Methanofollis ethanolicus TaxID=488124 RepID=UPI0013667608|nr:Ig-like domain-containing protein [Methanofollis ethanolicus]